jgi:acetoacetate decarboxylase
MEQPGRLTRDTWGNCMPICGPLYPKPPYYYKNAEAISVSFETDAEAAAALVPEGLTVPSPAIVTVGIYNYHFSTLGAYYEALMAISVTFNGAPAAYIPLIVVDNDQAMTAGREIWGYPKKLANISLKRSGEAVIGTVERPTGNRLCTAVVQPEAPAKVEPSSAPGLCLRVLPTPYPTEDGRPDRAQLIATRVTQEVHSNWVGRSSLSFGAISQIDPWALPINKLLGGAYSVYDLCLPLGEVVKEY